MWILLILVLGIPTIAQADYTRAIVRSTEINSDGTATKIFRFLGDSGEQEVVRRFHVPSGGDPDAVNYWVKRQLDELNGVKAGADDIKLDDGATVLPKAPPAPTRSARDNWMRDLILCDQLKGLTLTGQLATDTTALCAGLNASYKKGFLD